MPDVTYPLSTLRAKAQTMPPGYLDDVLRQATVNEAADTYTMPKQAYDAARAKWRNPVPVATPAKSRYHPNARPVVLDMAAPVKTKAQCAKPAKGVEPCAHRGDKVGEEKCPTCKGHVMVALYACSVHGKCALGQVAGVKSCVGCKDNPPHQVGKAHSPTGNEIKLRLVSKLCPGDILMLTAAVRDLHRAFPGKYLTDVETSAMELWDNNPHVTPMPGEPVRRIDMHYPLVNHSNTKPYHFIHGYRMYLEQQLGVTIPATDFKGDVYLSREEKSWLPQVEQEFGHKGAYWILPSLGKQDYTAKHWNPNHLQAVVDHFRGRVMFVQTGEAHHIHVPLDGTLNLIGKTNIRQFVRLMYHADGVLCGVTFPMHLAAAVETPSGKSRPCVVVAGGREPPHWEAYPWHQFLHTIGAFPCCASGGCWRSRCQKVGDGDSKDTSNLCERPVTVRANVTMNKRQLTEYTVPECMDSIRPEDVIRAVEMYL